MIIALTALILNSASVAATPELVPSQLSEIFQSACLDGEARLAEGSAVPVDFNDLPDELRGRLGSPASSKV